MPSRDPRPVLTDRTQLLGILRRFLARVEQQADSGCWLWTGAINAKGYPVIRIGRRVVYAHRLSFELFNGPIPRGEQVHHRCLLACCCNPEHLEATTPERNRRLQALGVGREDDADLSADIPI